MQRNTTKLGVVVANSSCLHLDLDLCSCFSFDVVSVSLCRMHNIMYWLLLDVCRMDYNYDNLSNDSMSEIRIPHPVYILYCTSGFMYKLF